VSFITIERFFPDFLEDGTQTTTMSPRQRAKACSPGRVREPWVRQATNDSPRQRAKACSPGRVREPWVRQATNDSPRQRAAADEAQMTNDSNQYSGESFSVARGRGLSLVAWRTQGSRTRPGLHALARGRGLVVVAYLTQSFRSI